MKLYEKAFDMLFTNQCSDGKYFGKVISEYGIILAMANRHCEAASCFHPADSLGIDQDKYYDNGD